MSQLDLLADLRPELPDEVELARRFAVFNATLFASELPVAAIRWSHRMRIAGTCEPRKCLITLSRSYHEQFPRDVDDTLKHEMIHLCHRGHGSAFRSEALRVGASVHCREYDGLHPRARYVYLCPVCLRRFPRMKQGELYCGRCARGRLDHRYRLQLLSPEYSPAAVKRASGRGSEGAIRSATSKTTLKRRASHSHDLFSRQDIERSARSLDSERKSA